MIAKIYNSILSRPTSIILIVMLLLMIFNFPLESQNLKGEELVKEGIFKYKNAYFQEAINILELALNFRLDKETRIKSYLYLTLSHFALERKEKVKRYFKEIIKLDSDFYLSSKKYSKEIIILFKESRDELSLVKNIKIEKLRFKPFLESTKIYFALSNYGDVELKIKRTGGFSSGEFIRKSKKNKLTDYFSWNGLYSSNNLVFSGLYEYIIEAKNRISDEVSMKKKIVKINVTAPYGYKLLKEIHPTKEVRTSGLTKAGLIIAIVLTVVAAVNSEKELNENPDKGTATQSLTILGIGLASYGIPLLLDNHRAKIRYQKELKKYEKIKRNNSLIRESVVIEQKEIKE